VVFIISDVILSLAPIVFLRKLRRPLSEKITISILMGLGLTASGAAIAKLVYSRRVHDFDISWTLSDAIVCCWSEITLGIIAACMPCLKGLFEGQLRKVGILRSEPKSYYRTSKIWEGRGWSQSQHSHTNALPEERAAETHEDEERGILDFDHFGLKVQRVPSVRSTGS
jgi:hypothetical protein